MKDIARDLGVSQMTVSKALRNHSDISQRTRERVLKRTRALNYQPDWIARSMVRRRTYLVGLVLPDLMHSFFAEVASGVACKLQPLGYQVVILNTEENAEAERRHVENLINRKVDGFIIASVQRSAEEETFQLVAKSQTPFVMIDRVVPGLEANYVGVNDQDLGELAASHLIGLGCKRIAHIHGPNVSTGIDRLQGYRNALSRRKFAMRKDYIVSGQTAITRDTTPCCNCSRTIRVPMASSAITIQSPRAPSKPRSSWDCAFPRISPSSAPAMCIIRISSACPFRRSINPAS